MVAIALARTPRPHAGARTHERCRFVSPAVAACVACLQQALAETGDAAIRSTVDSRRACEVRTARFGRRRGLFAARDPSRLRRAGERARRRTGRSSAVRATDVQLAKGRTEHTTSSRPQPTAIAACLWTERPAGVVIVIVPSTSSAGSFASQTSKRQDKCNWVAGGDSPLLSEVSILLRKYDI